MPLQTAIGTGAGCLKIGSQLSTDHGSPQVIPESYWSYPSLQKKSEQINPKRAAKLHTMTEEVA